jgi:DNA polymerase (family 10)
MTPRKAADHFAEIAALLEIVGENSFRIRGFSSAARSLEGFSGSLPEALIAAQNKSLKGFGPQLSSSLAEFAELGSTATYRELVQTLGEEFVELLSLPGVGPKKAKALRETTTIRSLADLEAACRDGSLAAQKGFGTKTVESLIAAIEEKRSRRGFIRVDSAEKLITEISDALTPLASDRLFSVTGAARRGFETIREIEFIGALPVDAVTSAILSLFPSAVIGELHAQLGRFELTNSTLVTVHCCSPSDFHAQLFTLSADAAHLSNLEARATAQGTSLAAVVAAAETTADVDRFETSIYRALKLKPLSVYQREATTSMEASTEGDSEPILVESLSGIIHAHSTYSDGTAELSVLARHVRDMGYHYLGISDHSQSAFYARGLSVDSVLRQHDEIDKLNEELAPFIILKGIESDILKDGSLDYPETILERFDFVIASIHSQLKGSKQEMTERLRRAIANPFTTSLGHVTTRKLLERGEAEIDIEHVLELAAEHAVAVEINANPRRLDLPYRFHSLAKRLGVLMPICPDAHSLLGVEDVRFGITVAKKGGLDTADVPTAWNAPEAIKFWQRARN